MGNTVPFTKGHVLEYLDRCIVYWREQKESDSFKYDQVMYEMSKHYIDAYQSVRMSLFGKLLLKGMDEK